MSESEFNAKSPAWHMAQIRKRINEAKTAREKCDGREERRRYWEDLQKRVSASGPMYIADIAKNMVY